MLIQITQTIIPFIQHFHIVAYLIVFFVAIIETVVGLGFLLPGSTLILIFGAFASRGYFNVVYIAIFAIIGAILGDNINYLIGKKYGKKWIKNGIWFIKDSHLKSVKDFFDRHGPKSVFIGRFIPSLKEIVPFIAGTAEMKRSTFFFWNLLGSFGWVIELVGVGYIFGQSISLAQSWLSRTGFFFASVVTIFIIFYIIKVFFETYGIQLFSTSISVIVYVWTFIINKTGAIKLAIRYPRFFGFLKDRFNLKSFYGLPLTLFAISFVYIINLMNGVVGSILNSYSIVSADVRIANLFSVFRTPVANKVFLWITLLGKWEIITMFVLAVIIILIIQHRRIYIVPLLISVLGGQFLTQVGKLAIHRVRPSVAMFAETSFSFPSGHATIAITFYGFLTYIILKGIESWRTNVNIVFMWIILVVLIGFSRLYFGVHYVSDIWGGYLSGILWLIVGIGTAEWMLSKQKDVSMKIFKTEARAKIVSLLVISSVFTMYVWFVAQYTPIITPVTQSIATSVKDPNEIFLILGEKSKYTESIIGDQQEPISFIIIAKNDDALTKTFQNSGWILADEIATRSLIKAALASSMQSQYKTAPITPAFWNENINDIGIQKETQAKNIKERHHARFWKTNFVTETGQHIYVGTASLDIAIKWRVLHKIDPNIDAEREFLLKDIISSNNVDYFKSESFVSPEIGHNLAGDEFFTDGNQYIIYLKDESI